MLTLLALSAAPLACSDAHFSPIEREDAATVAEDAPRDIVPASDPPPDPLVCEPADAVVCTPTACDSVCHTRQGAVPSEGDCTISYATDGRRFDDCAAGNVCLSDGFGSAHCSALCRSPVDCLSERACTARPLAGGMSIRVCDPPYRSCSSVSQPCCDPLAAGSCGADQYCYLVPPLGGSLDSRTVCDYLTGVMAVGQPCATSRDCLTGLACLPSSPSSPAGECRQVCNPAVSGSCSAGTCTAQGQQWGLCSG